MWSIQAERDRAEREDIKNINDFMERKGEELFGAGIGDLSALKNSGLPVRVEESEDGIHIMSDNLELEY